MINLKKIGILILMILGSVNFINSDPLKISSLYLLDNNNQPTIVDVEFDTETAYLYLISSPSGYPIKLGFNRVDRDLLRKSYRQAEIWSKVAAENNVRTFSKTISKSLQPAEILDGETNARLYAEDCVLCSGFEIDMKNSKAVYLFSIGVHNVVNQYGYPAGSYFLKSGVGSYNINELLCLMDEDYLSSIQFEQDRLSLLFDSYIQK